MDRRAPSEQLTVKVLPFDDLDLRTLYELLALRTSVFCVEQNCPYQDIDGKDPLAWHVLVHRQGELAGTARVLMPGESYPDASSVGRVANRADLRGQKIGQVLMDAAVKACELRFPEYPIRIGAQRYLSGFYSQFGFVQSGPDYLEDGIVHVPMIKPVSKTA